ncbi:MAG: AMP-binding protein [Bacteroidota bacterium]
MIELKPRTLLNVLNTAAQKYPDLPSVHFINKEKITFAEFKKKVDTITLFLKSEGITTGDRVAIISENQPNWAIAYFAVTTMGAVAIPIMTEFHSTEVYHILRHSESKALFVSARYFNKVEDFSGDSLQTRILIDDFSIIPPETKNDLIKEVINGGKKEFAKIKEAALKFVGLIPDEVKEESTASILYTSGTTGHSKGVILTHSNIVSNAISTLGFVDVVPGDRMLSILPLFHTIESTLGLVIPFIAGANVTYLDKPPTASVLLPALSAVKPTIMLAVPLIIEKIFRLRILPEINKKPIIRGLYKLPAVRKKLHKIAGKKLMKTFGGELKMFCIGGASLAADVERFLKEAQFPYAIGYGLTETSPLVTGTSPANVRFRAAGAAIPNVKIKLNNPDPKTGEGEVFVKGPNVMKGYYKDPDRTKEVFDCDGWFKTGDLAIIDEDGYLFIKGRSKNVIIGPNGKNIYPEEIESLINEFDFVLESLVIERKDGLIARIYLNYEQIDEEFRIQRHNEAKAREIINQILKDLLIKINVRVNTFSKINKIIEQREPFEKTPTQKIKRFLYVDE